MINPLPAIFISHGAPDLPIRGGEVSDFLRSLHRQFPKPKAILVVSAHWHSDPIMVSAAKFPKTIYDFSGFSEQLYQLSYPARGIPELSDRIVDLLGRSGIPCNIHPTRGLDHGAWTPLILTYPEADIPVTQLSIEYQNDPLYHWQVGQALEPLRHEGVLILGSGGITHNLYAFNVNYDATPLDWVQEFDMWIAKTIAEGSWDDLINYRRLAPYASKNHPTDEHLLPLFVALGAGGANVKGMQLHSSYAFGAFSMAAYAFASGT
ncbi:MULTISPECIES: DODA-type extradiol aromatic ring-opening family dioxygenase [Pseudanabaena]|uniref:Extradiol ring-cleavage dioxygenase class III protein subunit B n=2 Tax=Pseudanabaena TaxID=1152 RepID=L8MX99_9CYAN|nr:MULTISPECIES: class III extradiol ring-cleavage dioxygenase [Pseudanabaena]ELS31085.1 Extradiol ring-cleavage dioxygenase class III protein subunit B [Pseudanabaena biceps PCC 7429]MDG3496652.1 class III extradiol ring-cleavage dioxygenase [Pseudanabaena catenata USMAC16]